MEVHIESEGAVSSLHSADSSGVGVGNAREVKNGFGSLAQRTVELVRVIFCTILALNFSLYFMASRPSRSLVS